MLIHIWASPNFSLSLMLLHLSDVSCRDLRYHSLYQLSRAILLTSLRSGEVNQVCKLLYYCYFIFSFHFLSIFLSPTFPLETPSTRHPFNSFFNIRPATITQIDNMPMIWTPEAEAKVRRTWTTFRNQRMLTFPSALRSHHPGVRGEAHRGAKGRNRSPYGLR